MKVEQDVIALFSNMYVNRFYCVLYSIMEYTHTRKNLKYVCHTIICNLIMQIYSVKCDYKIDLNFCQLLLLQFVVFLNQPTINRHDIIAVFRNCFAN